MRNPASVLFDVSGNLATLQAGSPATGSVTGSAPGVLVAGSDGQYVRLLRTTADGTVVMTGSVGAGGPFAVVGSVQTGSTAQHAPVLFAATSGSTVIVPSVAESEPAPSLPALVVRNVEVTRPTFYAVFDRVQPAANKYVASLFNTSPTKKAVVQRMWCYNWQIATVAGALLEQYVVAISSRSIGTPIACYAEDSTDVLPAGITADTNSLNVVELNLIRRFITQGDEAITNLGQLAGAAAAPGNTNTLLYERMFGTRGLALRQNQGISIRNVTNSSVGTVSYVIQFTVEEA